MPPSNALPSSSNTAHSNATPSIDDEERAVEVISIQEYPSSPRVPVKDPPCITNCLDSTGSIQSGDDSSSSSSDSSDSLQDAKSRNRKWPTRWYWQFLVLTVRTFRQSRHVLLSKLNFIQTFLVAAVVSLLWFQMPQDEESISDRNGYVSDSS